AASSRKRRTRTRAASSGSCSKPLYQSGCSNPTANTASPANVSRSPPDARRTTLCRGGVAAGALDDHPRRHLVLVLERAHLAVVLFQEPLARPPKRVREPRRHGDAGEIGRLPELGLGGGHVDSQVRTQPLFHPVGE